MRTRLQSILAMSALGFGLAVTPASALESRNTNFLFLCDGTNKTINFNASALGVSINRFIVGAELSLFENRGGLQYVILRALGDPTRQLLTLGGVDNSRSTQFSNFMLVTTNAAGNVPFTIDGACNGGAGQVQGNVTIWFFS